MAKAAFATVVVLVLHTFVLGQELSECSHSPKASVLLQVDHSRPHSQQPKDEPSQRSLAQTVVAEAAPDQLADRALIEADGHPQNDDSEVSMKELLRTDEYLQSQIDDLKEKFEGLETKVESHTSYKGQGNDEGREGSGSKNKEEDNMETDWSDPDYKGPDSDDSTDDSSSRRRKRSSSRRRKRSTDDSSSRRRKRSSEDDSTDDSSSRRRKRSSDEPDFEGIAPLPHWNGLEEVNAQDHGLHDSRKGKGVGVSTGHAYKGEHPYEPLMDIDYIIDSNPAPASAIEKAKTESKSGGKTEETKHAKGESKHGRKAKQQSKQGGKTEEAAKVSPKSDGKSSPKDGATSSEAQTEKATKTKGKSAPKVF